MSFPSPVHHDATEAKGALAWIIADKFSRTIGHLIPSSPWWIVPYAIPWRELSQGFWESQGHFSPEYLENLYQNRLAQYREEHSDYED